MQTDIAIVGGGVAGAAAALALARQGLRVILVDLGRGHDLNRGDNLWPASVEILDRLGALDRLKAAGALAASGLEFHHPDLGALLEMDLRQLDGPYPYMLNLPHVQVVDELQAAARAAGAEVVLGERVQGLLWADDRVVGIRLPGRELRTQLVVGADGAFSGVRDWMGVGAETRPYDFSYIVLHGPRPAGYPTPLRTISHLSPRGVVVTIPLPDERIRVAAAVPASQVSRWKSLPPEEIWARLARRQPLLAGVELEAHGEHYYRLMQMHAHKYWVPGAALLGDAAHVTAPFTGQGINLAMQDAAELAQRVAEPLAAVAAGTAGPAAVDLALWDYERIRRGANATAMVKSDALASLALPRTPADFNAAVIELLSRGPAARAQQSRELTLVAAGK